jgi:hypothetical protein
VTELHRRGIAPHRHIASESGRLRIAPESGRFAHPQHWPSHQSTTQCAECWRHGRAHRGGSGNTHHDTQLDPRPGTCCRGCRAASPAVVNRSISSSVHFPADERRCVGAVSRPDARAVPMTRHVAGRVAALRAVAGRHLASVVVARVNNMTRIFLATTSGQGNGGGHRTGEHRGGTR